MYPPANAAIDAATVRRMTNMVQFSYATIIFANLSQLTIILHMYDTLKAILKSKGYSLTEPRKLVFELMLDRDPQTIAEIITRANGRVDRATVYRTTQLFENIGITHRLNIGWKYKLELSDAFVGHHHHLHCTNCGKTYDLPANTMLETMIDSVATKEDFSPRGHQLEIYGLCSNCRKTD